MESLTSRMLDIRGYILAARRTTQGITGGAALVLLVAFGAIALVMLPVWVVFDLDSTWTFTTGLRDVAEPAVYDITTQAGGVLGLSLSAALAGAILTAFTLLPTLFELAFPTVNHPLLRVILTVSITFDYVTDWGKSAELVAGWVSNPLAQFVGTVVACAFFSVGVQAVLAIALTVCVYAALSIVRGGAQGRATVING